MPRLLYVEASPRKERSTSIRVAGEFLDTYRDAHPRDVVDVVDLWQEELPPLDGEAINAKYAILHGQSHSTAQAAAWAKITAVADRFTSADKYLFSLPMWNFGIPYRLKHYIDVITQPGLTFTFSPAEGYKGMVTGKAAAVIYARGGEYQGDGASWDFQKPYFELWLQFIGFTDVRGIVVEPTLGNRDATEKSKAAGCELARRTAIHF
ncbi:MAG TPA: NAD(P)H-dependent oxidoreductase [Phycisphaerae bacterium]|nr:NAD(P)H-dependent oxidoreductase [Phycisphaerae bacterium]HRR87237.1 NAD(P)H-dependent oxidoreductase [Phycisphaerae bacterium]